MSVVAEHLHTLSRIWRHPRADRSELLAFQERKLRVVVQTAYRDVPYYRNLFDEAGIRPEKVECLADLACLPFTSSREFRQLPLKETMSHKARSERMVTRATSGSSGRPFLIRRTAWEDHLLNLFAVRAQRDWGLRPFDRIASVGFVSASHHRESLPGRLRHAAGIHRRYPVDCLDSDEGIVRRLQEIGPDVVSGFPSVLSHVSPMVAARCGDAIRPRVLFTGGETLTPWRRQRIERGFGARLFDRYGAHEFNLLGWECTKTGDHHVCEDGVIVEILRDGRPAAVGEVGEVVVTGLHCHAVPFIRYRLGDTAVRGPERCDCGAPFSTLRGIRGRMHEYFPMPDGDLIHPDRIIVPIMEQEAAWIAGYRVRQLQEDLVVMEIQPLDPPGAEHVASVEALGRKELSPRGVEFRVTLVETLPFEKSGKFRFTESLLSREPDTVDWARVQ